MQTLPCQSFAILQNDLISDRAFRYSYSVAVAVAVAAHLSAAAAGVGVGDLRPLLKILDQRTLLLEVGDEILPPSL